MLTPEMIAQVARIAEALRPWGLRLAVSVDLSSPKVVGGLDTFDPLDPRVIAWWQKKVDEVYAKIPDFGGFVVKADSEGRAGPLQYGRTPVDAANVLARALNRTEGCCSIGPLSTTIISIGEISRLIGHALLTTTFIPWMENSTTT